MFSKILIANRGEIACRVASTARAMGISTVAVYSEPDANALHVEAADEAVALGGTAAAESYLDIEKIISAAKSTGAEAIHPGYGFLSENTDFSRRCHEEGIAFIGPGAEAIRIMGSKREARVTVAGFDVPVLPGYDGEDQDADVLAAAADDIGYPVLIKATAGGGGKGMRVVESNKDIGDSLAAVKRESKKAFGDDRVILEKYLPRARHVEVQVFADTHGSTVHLFERDCSMQRRNQKVIEEAPAPDLPDDVRQAMHAAAINCARSVNYVGAGTVEFLLGPDNGFYFMEMNTRLQVEHPVTEMVTGLDLVEWQLRVAAGETLPLTQEQITRSGHAMEARVYAENPEQGFLPATGEIGLMQTPPAAGSVRIDTGVRQGDEISIHYDPMIAKLIVHGPNRQSANQKLSDALAEFSVLGLQTNIPFLRTLAVSDGFAGPDLSTRYIEQNEDALVHQDIPKPDLLAALGAALVARGSGPRPSDSPWVSAANWRNALPARSLKTVRYKDEQLDLVLTREGNEEIVESGDIQTGFTIQPAAPGRLAYEHNGTLVSATVLYRDNELSIDTGSSAIQCTVIDRHNPDTQASSGAGSLAAPMPGMVIAVPVEVGDTVEPGTTLVIIEAMKMEHQVKAPGPGKVAAIHFSEGEQVKEGEQLLTLEDPEA